MNVLRAADWGVDSQWHWQHRHQPSFIWLHVNIKKTSVGGALNSRAREGGLGGV